MKSSFAFSPYVLALLFVCVSSCQDNSVSAIQDNSVSADPLALSGTVVDHFTQEPIADVAVQISVLGDTYVDTTDANGAYRFDAIEPARVPLTAMHDAYCPHSDTVQMRDSGTRYDIFLGKDAPIAWDAWIRLDSVKVSCDDRPANYTFQFKCHLEDKESFQSTEYIAFYVSMGYKLHYVYPQSITTQGILFTLTFGNDREIRKFFQNAYEVGSDGVFDFTIEGGEGEMDTAIPGEELQDLSIDNLDLHPELEVWHWYQVCGTDVERREETPLQVEFSSMSENIFR